MDPYLSQAPSYLSEEEKIKFAENIRARARKNIEIESDEAGLQIDKETITTTGKDVLNAGLQGVMKSLTVTSVIIILCICTMFIAPPIGTIIGVLLLAIFLVSLTLGSIIAIIRFVTRANKEKIITVLSPVQVISSLLTVGLQGWYYVIYG